MSQEQLNQQAAAGLEDTDEERKEEVVVVAEAAAVVEEESPSQNVENSFWPSEDLEELVEAEDVREIDEFEDSDRYEFENQPDDSDPLQDNVNGHENLGRLHIQNFICIFLFFFFFRRFYQLREVTQTSAEN